ncbi:MAG: ABC-2 family transporter protein, partial [Caldilineaceae bacterium]|nr:ABC-2 family transporter protein [Caldilineaceae bacterium]
SVRQVEIWKLIDIIMGLGVLVIALARLGAQIGMAQALAFGVALLAGATIVYSFWMMLATCAFWFVKTENILVIFQSMYQAGRWPITIYPGWLQMMLTFLVPIAFAVTVPAQALTGRLTNQTLLLAILVATGLFGAARWFWRFGIRYYAGASA